MLDVQKVQPSEVGYKVNPNKNVEVLPESVVPDAFPHNPIMDSKRRVWVTDLGRYGGPEPGAEPAPASTLGTLTRDSGPNWGGGAFDPETNRL